MRKKISFLVEANLKIDGNVVELCCNKCNGSLWDFPLVVSMYPTDTHENVAVRLFLSWSEANGTITDIICTNCRKKRSK